MKKSILGMGGAFVVGLLVMYVLMSSLSVSTVTVSTDITHVGQVHIEAWHPNGQVFYDVWTHNTFTNQATNITTNRGLMMNYTFTHGTMASWYNNTMTVIELGNDSGTAMSVSSTALTQEDTSVCTRQNGTLSWPVSGGWQTNSSQYQVTYTWSGVSAAVTLNATGECFSTTGSTADLGAFATFTTATLASGDSIQVTWLDTVPSG
jgi:hypothetical protein